MFSVCQAGRERYYGNMNNLPKRSESDPNDKGKKLHWTNWNNFTYWERCVVYLMTKLFCNNILNRVVSSVYWQEFRAVQNLNASLPPETV